MGRLGLGFMIHYGVGWEISYSYLGIFETGGRGVWVYGCMGVWSKE